MKFSSLTYTFWVFIFAASSYGCQQNNSKVTAPSGEQSIVEKDSTMEGNKKVIVFFGNSLTAGYRLDLSEAFPALIQDRVDSLGLNYRCINAGLSGETTASGNSRVDWVLKNEVDIFVLELGANDGLRGIGTGETMKNLQSIVDKVKGKYPNVQIVIAGMMIPPNMGQEYTDDFQSIFPKLANKNQLPLIPFLLKGVAGNPDLNLDDGIHPTPEGHQILMENVWAVLSSLVQSKISS